MTNGLSTILAVTLAGSLLTSQVKLFNSAYDQVQGINTLMMAGIDQADAVSSGIKILAQ